MKKLLTFSMVALLMSSCGSKPKDAASADYGVEEANSVIKYYNTVISATKKLVEERSFDDILEYMQVNGRKLSPVVTRFVMERDTAGFTKPSGQFPDEVRDSLKVYTKQYVDAAEKFYANYETYKNYIKAEDFKDDNYAKGKEILAEEEKLAVLFPELRTKIFDLITPYADKAEEVILVGNPLKDHIMAGKALLSSAEEVLNIYDPAAKTEAMQKLYDTIQKNYDAAKALQDVANQSSAMRSFKELLDYTEKFQGDLRKQLRSGKFNEDGYDDLSTQYSMMISRYNGFVN